VCVALKGDTAAEKVVDDLVMPRRDKQRSTRTGEHAGGVPMIVRTDMLTCNILNSTQHAGERLALVRAGTSMLCNVMV
jgi:hypothetical protein